MLEWLRNLLYRWKYRNETKQEFDIRKEKAKEELRIAICGVREEFKNDPADKWTHELYEVMDEVEETILSK